MAEWAFRADAEAVLDALASGAHAASLCEYFGAEAYVELARLAARAGSAPAARGGPQVWVLPGIMGSKLGGEVAGKSTPQILWIDPDAIAAGGLRDLALPAGRSLRPLGVLLFGYARLTLQLRLDGFETHLYPYDWRLGLDELGEALAGRIREAGAPVILVGHSMGGLVARMAMGRLPRRAVRKLIMLGTPNLGSYAPVLALRGTYPFVRKLARLDPVHSPDFLAEHAFHTFPGLYQLLPPRRRLRGADLYRRSGWPAHGPKPNLALLAQIAGVHAQLAPADGRMAQIVGVNHKTIVGVHRKAAGFEYEFGLGGDGTVPLRLATLPGIKTFFVDERHANLANNAAVIRAIVGLIRRGRTSALTNRRPRWGSIVDRIDDAQLRADDGPKIDWWALDPLERAATLAKLSE